MCCAYYHMRIVLCQMLKMRARRDGRGYKKGDLTDFESVSICVFGQVVI